LLGSEVGARTGNAGAPGRSSVWRALQIAEYRMLNLIVTRRFSARVAVKSANEHGIPLQGVEKNFLFTLR
jgi:hypothetical protein